jgi:hypothetical protein
MDETIRKDMYCKAILLAFTPEDKKIIYDYTIPSAYHLTNKLNKLIKRNFFSPTFKINIQDIIYSNKDEYSYLDNIYCNQDNFGHEWFFGLGDVFRWRLPALNQFFNIYNDYFTNDEKFEWEKLHTELQRTLRNKDTYKNNEFFD